MIVDLGSEMKAYYLLCILLSLPVQPAIFATGAAPQTSGEALTARWEPNELKQGSPCLFTVESKKKLKSLVAEWPDGRKVYFNPDSSNKIWRGFSVVAADGSSDNDWIELRGIQLNAKPVNQRLQLPIEGSPIADFFKHGDPPDDDSPSPEQAQSTSQPVMSDWKVKQSIFARISPKPLWSERFIPPVEGFISSRFGAPRPNGKLHEGIDYAIVEGTLVKAMSAGNVVFAAEMSSEGNFVVLDHGQGLFSLYFHLSEFKVAKGDWVEAGDVVGLSGNTGKSAGPHLHAAVRWQGIYIDPAAIYDLSLPPSELEPVRSRAAKKSQEVKWPVSETPVEIVNPKVRFTPDTDQLSLGECAQLSWKVSQAEGTTLDGAKVKSSGEQKVCPTVTRTYTLSVKAKDGGVSDYAVTIRVQKPRFSFVARAASAAWFNQSRETLTFGFDSGDRGRALKRDVIKLEDGSAENNVVEMRPMLGGSVSGSYRLPTAIQRGDVFRVAVGFSKAAPTGRVILRVLFQPESAGRKKEVRELLRVEKARNGWVPDWEYDLSKFAGRRGVILLEAISLTFDSQTDGVCWINPRIER